MVSPINIFRKKGNEYLHYEQVNLKVRVCVSIRVNNFHASLTNTVAISDVRRFCINSSEL